MNKIIHHNPNLRSGNKGTQFEEEILYTMNVYNQGEPIIVCYLERCEVPKIMSRGRIIYLEKKGFDLMGGVRIPLHITTDIMAGKIKSSIIPFQMIHLCIEAKNIDDALPILDDSVSFNSKGKKKSKGHGVKAHQLQALCELQKSGAICMILWKTRVRLNAFNKSEELKVYKLDPLQIMSEVGMGKSITIEKHKSLLTEVQPYGLAWDFLNLLKRN